jgi:hypothetical protein
MARDPKDMENKLQHVFDRSCAAKLRIHPAKCQWSVVRVKFLGQLFDETGMSVDNTKIDIVRNFPIAKTSKQVKGFLSLCSYCGRLVAGFSQISSPLRGFLKKEC